MEHTVPLPSLPHRPLALTVLVMSSHAGRDTAAALEAALQFPAWVGPVMNRVGLIVLVIGAMAWWGSRRPPRRAWGRRLCTVGLLLAIVGANFPAFISLLKYVIQSP